MSGIHSLSLRIENGKFVLNLAELEKLYAEMGDLEFARLCREDLVTAARPYYDRERRRRGLPETRSRPRPVKVPGEPVTVTTQKILAEARNRLASSLEADVKRAEKLYAEMSEEDFAQIGPADVSSFARPFYEHEVRRRGLPDPESLFRRLTSWLSEKEAQAATLSAPICDPETIFREAERRRDARRSEREWLTNQPRSGQGPWRVLLFYKTMVVPAKQRGDKLIVWLRRFHVRHAKGLRFSELLVAACQGLGYPLTVQDSTFKSSDAEFMPQFLPVLLVWGCWGTATLFIKPELFFTWALLPGIVLVFLMFFLGGRLGYHDLQPESAQEETLGLIDEIRQREGHHGDDSVLIVRCQDSFWRDIVQLSLRFASALVIDVTEVSDNVIWELKTALRLMAPESITLVRGLRGSETAGLPREVQEALVAELGAEDSSRVQCFFYPQGARKLDYRKGGQRESLEMELRARLAVAVAFSEQRRAFGISHRNC